MKWTLILTLVLGFAAVAHADEILLNAGEMLEGEIQSVDEKGMVVKTDQETVTLEPHRVDAHFYYTQWSKRVKGDAKAHLRLAVFAYENGMFNQSRSQYRKAQRLDKALVERFEKEMIPQIKEGIADQLLTLVKSAIERKDWSAAKRIASKILTQLEDTKAAEKARDALASVHMWQLSADEEHLVRSLARYLPKDEAKALQVQERIVKKLAPIESRIEKARKLGAKALRTKSTNRQKNIFQQVAKRFEKIVEDLDKLTADAGDDEALKARIQANRDIAVREAINAYVNAGNTYLVRRSYDEALHMADLALALDPDSQAALSFKKRTIAGSQMRSGWHGRGRGR